SLEGTFGRVTLFGGAHVASGRSTLAQPTTTPGGLFEAPIVGSRSVTVARSSAGPVLGGAIDVSGTRGAQLRTITYREEHARIASVGVTDRVATLNMAEGRLAFSVSAGQRSASDEQTSYGSVSAAIDVASSAALQIGAGSYPSNR